MTQKQAMQLKFILASKRNNKIVYVGRPVQLNRITYSYSKITRYLVLSKQGLNNIANGKHNSSTCSPYLDTCSFSSIVEPQPIFTTGVYTLQAYDIYISFSSLIIVFFTLKPARHGFDAQVECPSALLSPALHGLHKDWYPRITRPCMLQLLLVEPERQSSGSVDQT